MFRERVLKSWLVWVSIGLMAAGTAIAQGRSDSAPGRRRDGPDAVRPQVEALGQRFQAPGKERTEFRGRLIDAQGRESASKITLQLPALVRLEGFGPVALTFDGETRSRRNTKAEDRALEVFVMDTAEGMLAALQRGASVRVIGRGVGPGPGEKDDGRRYDIYEVVGPVPSGSDDMVRWKLYSFDSATRLLASTRYVDGDIRVETRFSDWRTQEGSAYPGRIERLEDGQRTFVFVADQITAGSRVEAADFR